MMKKGFLLLETIVVIFVLCTLLITLYIAYSNTTNTVKSQLHYDNTEYVYKTYILKSFLEEKIINEANYSCSNCESVYIFCSNQNSSQVTSCLNLPTNSDDDYYLQAVVRKMKINAIYITKWDTTTFKDNPEIMSIFEATTQRYIRSLNPIKKEEETYRIIIMFENENDSTIEYASLSFDSKIRSIS